MGYCSIHGNRKSDTTEVTEHTHTQSIKNTESLCCTPKTNILLQVNYKISWRCKIMGCHVLRAGALEIYSNSLDGKEPKL